jgi:maleate cis-trans isomerase
MPDGVGVIPVRVGVRSGEEQVFLDALETAKQRVADLADLGVDVITITGTPLTMLKGHEGNASVIQELEAQYGIPIVTATGAAMEAFEALNIRSMVLLSYLTEDLNEKFADFLREGGLEVKAIGRYVQPFDSIHRIPPQEIYALAKRVFLDAGGADGIYLYGAGWRTLPIIEALEQDLQTKVVSNVPADVWATLRKLKIRYPIDGYGALLRTLPTDA